MASYSDYDPQQPAYNPYTGGSNLGHQLPAVYNSKTLPKGTVTVNQMSQPTQQQPSSGGGGSSGPNMDNYRGWDPAAAYQDWLKNPNKFNMPSQDDINRQIDEAYGASYGYLDKAEGALRSDFPNALAEAEAMFKTNSSTLGNQKASAGEALDVQGKKAQKTKESALSAARRLYQEQGIGANQRFGGSSSAGQAFSELQSREQARNYGETERQYADVSNQIETQRNAVEREYSTGLLQLEQQKQTAVSNATRDFQNKLLQIEQNRAQIGQAKAEAKLGALQAYRTQVFQIEQQNTAFQQQLQLMREQANMQLSSFNQSSAGAVGGATQAAGAFNPQTMNTMSASQGMGMDQGMQQPQQMTGQIGGRRPDEDFNLVGSISSGLQSFFNPFPSSYQKANTPGY